MRPLDPRLRPHLAPARSSLAGALGASLLGGLLTVGQAFAVGALVVELVQDPRGDSWQPAAVWLTAIVVLRAAVAYVVDVASARAAGQVSLALRQRLMAAAVGTDATTLSRHRTGELALLATRGMTAVEPYLTRYLPALVLASVLPAATLAAIFWLDWVSGIIVLLTVPLVPVFAILIGLSTKDRADRQWRQLSALSGHFLDVVRGLPTLVAYRRARAQSTTIRAVTDRYRRATTATLKLAFASSVVLELVATISVALVAVCVGLRLAAGTLDFRTALVVLLLAPEAYWPLRRVGAEFHAAAEGTASFEAAHAFLVDARTDPVTNDVTAPTGIIELDDVTLGYARTPVVAGLSASFATPGLTAVAGPSGGGKSTLMAALVGELRPTRGAIRVGGTELTDLNRDQWRREVAWAPQRPWLTAGTIADNIRVGRPDAGDDEIWQSLERVALDLTVAALPLGLDTPLGEDGAGLSAGQRARIALARVIVARRSYVFLDEPTAHLDQVTEAVFLDTMRWLAERSTVVVVAHREAVIEAADRVLTLPPSPTTGIVRDVSGVLGGVSTPKTSRTIPVEPRQQDTGAGRPGRFGRRTGVLLGILLGALSVAAGVALTATAAWLITRASQHPPVLMLMVAIVAVRTFGLARPALRYAERIVSHDAALRLLAERRAQVYDALVPLVPGRLGVRRGDVLTSVVDDVDSLVDEQLRVRQPWWTAALVVGGAAGLAGLLAPVAGLVVLGVALVAAVGTLVARRGATAAEADFVRQRAELSVRVEEILHGARQLDMWQATGPALEAMGRIGNGLAAAARRSARGLATGRALALLGCGLGLVAMAAAVPPGGTSPAMLALLVMLPLALADALLPAVDAGSVSGRTRAARERLEALTAGEPAVSDPAVPSPVPAGAPYLRVDRVEAGWGESDALRDLSLDLPPGTRIGVVGPSGSGKSTLAALLLRFIDPRTGTVTLSGTDLSDLALDDVRGEVGLVDDDPYVFGSNVAENIRLARPDADDADVEKALRAAHLGAWLDRLPEGLATAIGEGSALVSGGERARIGIARAMLAGQPVLVLDEPTAHLDAGTAREVSRDLLAASAGRSVVWITHGSIGLDAMDGLVRLGETGVEAQALAIR